MAGGRGSEEVSLKWIFSQSQAAFCLALTALLSHYFIKQQSNGVTFFLSPYAVPLLKRLFAIYGWMVFCVISTELACFVQNLVDWAFGIILCIVQNTVERLPV